MKFPNPVRRGHPNHEDRNLVHLYVPQDRPGMIENVDYSVRVACINGNYHINYSDNPEKITCPQCLEKMKGK
jgi:hypothetical protein